MTNDVRAEHFLGVPCTSELKSWREEEKQYLYLFIEDVWRIAASYWTTTCCYIAHFIPHHLTACVFVGVSKCEQPFIWTCLLIPPCVSLPELPIRDQHQFWTHEATKGDKMWSLSAWNCLPNTGTETSNMPDMELCDFLKWTWKSLLRLRHKGLLADINSWSKR